MDPEFNEPLRITPGAGASLWFVNDSNDGDGHQTAYRLDRKNEGQRPCVGRDAAILRALLQRAIDMLDGPPEPQPFPWPLGPIRSLNDIAPGIRAGDDDA